MINLKVGLEPVLETKNSLVLERIHVDGKNYLGNCIDSKAAHERFDVDRLVSAFPIQLIDVFDQVFGA